MNGWFLAIIIIQCLGIGIHLAKNGEPTKDEYNFVVKLIGSLISIGLIYMAIKTGF